MRGNRWVTALAVLLAVASGGAVYLYQTGADARALAGKHGVSVLVARVSVPAGTRLEDAITAQAIGGSLFPQSALPKDAVRKISLENHDLVLAHALGAGQLVLASNLSENGNPQTQIEVPPGRLAATIAVDDAARVASFVVPGSRVAVYFTPEDHSRASVLLEAADVIAVGNNSTSNALTDSTSANSALVTLALVPRDVPRVVLASKSGTLNLALLAAGARVLRGTGVTASSLGGSK